MKKKIKMHFSKVEVLTCNSSCRQHSLYCIHDFEHSRSQRQGSEFFLGEVDFMRWFPVAFLTNGAFIVRHRGIELTTPAL